jgi:hypothetical protein
VNNFDHFMMVMLTSLVSGSLGFLVASSTVDPPATPKFHERQGKGTRVAVTNNSLNETFLTFSYESKTYTIPFAVK